MKLQESAEDYLENILILKERDGFVRSVDLAKEMGFSKPSISRAVHMLENEGYLQIEDNGNIELTELGQETASHIYEKHIFLTNYFLSLGVDEETAAEDACRIEHVLSDKSFEAMKRLQEHCLYQCPRRSDLILGYINKKIKN